MSQIEELKQYIGKYQGEGINHEGESFTGKFELQAILEGKAYSISFQAIGKDGTIYYEENSQIAPSLEDKLCLWNINSNMPGLVPHELRKIETQNGSKNTFVFGYNKPDDKNTFREEISLDLFDNGDIAYRFSWGMPEGEFQARSSVRMQSIESARIDLNHLHLAVKDVEKSQEFYTKYFNFHKRTQHGNCAFMSNPDGYDLALDPDFTPETLPKWFHIGCRINTIKEVRALYTQIKETSEFVTRELEEYDDLVFFHCQDPDGYKIEVYWE